MKIAELSGSDAQLTIARASASGPKTRLRSAVASPGRNFRFSIFRFQYPQAFTLIELLLVLTIIGILAAATIGAGRYVRTKAKRSRAQAEIQALELGIEQFKVDSGAYPTSYVVRVSSSGLAELTNSWCLYQQLVDGPKRYFDFRPDQIRVSGSLTNIVDPFAKPYNYYRAPGEPHNVDNLAETEKGGQANAVTFDLMSYGADKKTFVSGAAGWFDQPDYAKDDITNFKQ